jgi:YD repeat-containing protein
MISSQHYFFSGQPSVLLKGNGSVITTGLHDRFIKIIAGTYAGSYSGDGGPAINAKLHSPGSAVVDALGNIYIADKDNFRIRKVDMNGIITTVAGNGEWGYSGDGGPATEAKLYYPMDVAVDPSGNIYIADIYNCRIRKVDTSGIITTIAGNGTGGYSGDGGHATDAQLRSPSGVAIDSSGNIYIADKANSRIRKVDTSGIITTIAGNKPFGYSGDGGPAIEAQLNNPNDLAVDPSGNIYIADTLNYRIRKVDTSGIITTIAGDGTSAYSGDGGSATDAKLDFPNSVAIGPSGNIYIADKDAYRIRKVDINGIITTIAGNGEWGSSGGGEYAIDAKLGSIMRVAIDPSGNIYLPDSYYNRIYKLYYFSPFSKEYGLASDQLLVPEGNGEGHIFTSSGRHLSTIDLDTGKTLRTFSYDDDDNLISITDRFGNETTIQRDAVNKPLSITSPDGIVTSLTVDSNNHLMEIRHPGNSAYSFTYTPSGLMTEMIDPNNNPFIHEFSSFGRVVRVSDSEGGEWQFDRSVDESGNVYASVLTGEGNLTQYLDTKDITGAYTSEVTNPAGGKTLSFGSADGLTGNSSLSCGMELGFEYGIDSKYKLRYIKQTTESTPALLEKVTLRDKTYQDTDADDIPDLITETVSANGNPTTLENDTLQSRRTITSPQGRTITTQYDPATLLTTIMSIPGLYNTTYGYDTRGRLTSVITDTRETSFVYNAQGFLASITDPEDYTTSYTYDPVGRITGIDRADQSSLAFSYDPKGNMTVLTNPSTIDHVFGYNGVNLNSSYQTPISGSYSYVYDKDRRLVQTNFPSGKTINNVYDKGRLIQILTPESSIDLSYICSTKVGSLTKGTEAIAYGYDGSLVTSEALSGTLNQSLAYTYNNDFNITSFTYAGDTEGCTYDFDGLLTGAGSFNIARNAANGLPESVSDGTFNLSRTFNGYGETDALDYTVLASISPVTMQEGLLPNQRPLTALPPTMPIPTIPWAGFSPSQRTAPLYRSINTIKMAPAPMR